jgi:hypothetical protein
MAGPAGLFRVVWEPKTAPEFTPLVQREKLMCPTKMALDHRGALLITDQGEADHVIPEVPWRAVPHRFGVSVLFPTGPLPRVLIDARAGSEPDQRDITAGVERLQSALRGIELVVEEQRPLPSFQVWKQQV